jgi:hypothetical protein
VRSEKETPGRKSKSSGRKKLRGRKEISGQLAEEPDQEQWYSIQ